MRILIAFSALLLCTGVAAQKNDSTEAPQKKKIDLTKIDLKNRANDHFMIQFGYDGWVGTPDSIRTTGFSRFFNAYVMLDKPFKSDPRFSVGLGVGIGSSNIFFEQTDIVLGSNNRQTQIQFRDVADTNHFKKYKLTNVWVEAPIELRFVAKPDNSNKSFKVAIGVKVGNMISTHTKGRDLVSASGQSIYGKRYIEKVKDRAFFNSTRLAATLRIGYGPLGLYGAYQITNLFREGQGPTGVRPYSIGLTLSGL